MNSTPFSIEKVVGRHVLVGEHADQVAVAVAALGVIEPHPVVEQHVGRVLDAELLLQGMAAADLHAAAAQNSPPADVEILVHDDDRRAVVARRDRRRQPGDARADHDHVGSVVPLDAAVAVLRGGLLRARSGDRDRADAGGGAAREEVAPVDLSLAGRACWLAHPFNLPNADFGYLLDDDGGSVRLPELRIKALPAGVRG